MSSRDEICAKLERLCGEYASVLRLEQHKQVSQLCLDICARLVELFDQELLQNDLEDDDQDGGEDSDNASNIIIQTDEWRLIDALCQQLRKQSLLAQVYGELVEFVREQDRICLLKLNLAPCNPRGRKTQQEGLSSSTCASVVRKCVIILRELPNRWAPAKQFKVPLHKWLPRARISRLAGVAFPRYSINLEPTGTSHSSASINELIESCLAQQGDGEKEAPSIFYKLLGAQWFRAFIGTSQGETSFYGFDRFTLLVALWIVASECGHVNLGQLVNELVGQLFHEETNSCNVDEFLLLEQTGAVWLSYKKRILVSLNRPEPNDQGADSDVDSTSDESFEDERAVSSTVSSQPSSPPPPPPERFTSERQRLRHLIDQELLIGRECLVCDRKPSGSLLEPIQLVACPACSTLLAPAHYCASSFEPLVEWLLPLEELLTHRLPQVNQLIVLSPNEWLQRAFEICDASFGLRLFASSEKTAPISEQVDISDRFERLTVVRRARSHEDHNNQLEEEEEEEEEEEDSNYHSKQRDDAEFADFDGQPEEPFEESLNANGSSAHEFDQLAAFFRWRYGQQPKLTQQMRGLSESLQLIRWKPASERQLFVNAADLLALGPLGDSLRLLLVAARCRDQTQTGGAQHLMACLARSQLSQLQRGCGRFFKHHNRSHLEHLHGGANKLDMAQDVAYDEQINDDNNNAVAAVDDETCVACGGQLVRLAPGNLQSTLAPPFT